MAEELLISQSTVKNCIGWTFNPLPQVGSPSGTLQTTPALDSASKVGCKSQSYTSWNCTSRSYIGGIMVTDGKVAPEAPRAQDRAIVGDVPTQQEIAAFSSSQMMLYSKGIKMFVRGKGLLTKAQFLKEVAPAQSSSVTTTSAGTTVRTRSQQTQDTDPNTGFYYSDILPVRSVAVSSMVCQREHDPVPYSPQYQILAGRLSDPAQTGVLASVVKGPNVRDATTMTSLVKAMSLRPSTRYEIAAMVRSGSMAMSVAEESYASDPIPYRFLRKPLNVSGSGLDILQKPGTDPDSWQTTAMPLDTCVALANNSYFSSTVPGFTYGGLDVTWTAVPVPSRLLGQTHLLAYVYSFLSSDAWSGTVSYRYSTTRLGPNKKIYRSNETYIPTVNSVDIPGPRNVCLVLIDETS